MSSTIQVSSEDHLNEVISEDLNDSWEDPIDHEFILKKTTGDKLFVNLEVPPYMFKKKKDTNKDGGTVSFVCQSEGCYAYAHAIKQINQNNGEVSFTLKDLPIIHSCSPSPVSCLVAKFRREIKSSIAKQPTRSIHDQFSVLRDEFTCEMSEDMKIAFIQEIPNLQQICPRLYNFRKTFIPAAPKTQSELATDTPFFMLKNGENAVKIDKALSGGRRVVGITSDAALGHLARATSICIDGTFKITPKPWFQVSFYNQ
jgi:hypothetical protein